MKRALRWVGFSAGGILLLVLLVLGGAMGFTISHTQRTYEIDPPELTTDHDLTGDELVATGARLLRVRGCVDCHAADLGGKVVIDDPMVGRIWGTNLTGGQGGVAHQYDDQRDWIRAIRHGVGPDGKPLVFMPAHEFYPIGDNDLAAIIAAIEAVEPVDRDIPSFRSGPISSLLFTLGRMPLLPVRLIDHTAPRPTAPEPAPTAEYGGYLATGCIGCHGETYAGGRIPGSPPSMPTPANITPDRETGIGTWSRDDFFRVMREGVRPDGREVNEFMPVALTREFTDMELDAMWLYLRSIEAKPFGER